MFRLLAILALCSAACAQSSQKANVKSESPDPPASATPNPNQDANALLPNLAPLPRGKTTLIGGTVRDVDRVLDQLVISAYGGQTVKVLFDERTLIYRGDTRASQRDLHPGMRVYAETMLDEGSVFARSIRLENQAPVGECHGQVISYDQSGGELVLRDNLSPKPIHLRVDRATQITGPGQRQSAELGPGALVDVQFEPGQAGHAIARQITVVARPGSSFTFQGEVIYLDMHRGILSLADVHSKRRYDIYFSPALAPADDALQEGADVAITAGLDNNRYTATSIRIIPQATR